MVTETGRSWRRVGRDGDGGISGTAQTVDAGGAQHDTSQRKIENDERTSTARECSTKVQSQTSTQTAR